MNSATDPDRFQTSPWRAPCLALGLFFGPVFVQAGYEATRLAWPASLPAGLVSSFTKSAALAQQNQGQGGERRKVRRDASMGAKVHEKLAEAQALSEDQQYAPALEILNSMRDGRKKLNGYELASVWNLIGFIYYSQERHQQAERAYQTALQQAELPVALESSLRYTLAQLYALQERYRESANMLLSWLKITTDPGPEPYVLLAQSYYQIEEIAPALASISKAFELSRRRATSPREGWYQLLMALHYHNRDYRKIVPILKQLIVTWPSAKYWLQLSGIYGELENEKLQLAVLETAYMQNMLTRGNQIVSLASLLLNHNAPWQGAKILEKGIEDGVVKATSRNLGLLSDALRSARETARAIVYLEQAAKKDKTGDGRLHAKLSRLYQNSGDYDKSVKAVQKALQLKNVRQPEDLWMTAGVSHFEMHRYEQARKAFRSMAESTKNKRQKQIAKDWVLFIKNEEEKERALEAGLATR